MMTEEQWESLKEWHGEKIRKEKLPLMPRANQSPAVVQGEEKGEKRKRREEGEKGEKSQEIDTTVEIIKSSKTPPTIKEIVKANIDLSKLRTNTNKDPPSKIENNSVQVTLEKQQGKIETITGVTKSLYNITRNTQEYLVDTLKDVREELKQSRKERAVMQRNMNHSKNR